MTKKLKELLDRVREWPPEQQQALLVFAQEIEAGQSVYYPTVEELEGIDRGTRDADAGNFATKEEMKRLFGEFLA